MVSPGKRGRWLVLTWDQGGIPVGQNGQTLGDSLHWGSSTALVVRIKKGGSVATFPVVCGGSRSISSNNCSGKGSGNYYYYDHYYYQYHYYSYYHYY